MADLDHSPRGGLTTNRESLHASAEYKRQVAALEQMRESEMDERMTPTLDGKLRCLQTLLHQIGAHVACEAVAEARDKLAETHLAQPSQAVDVGAIREVIAGLSCVSRLAGENDLRLRDTCANAADKLTRAVGNALTEVVAWISPGSLLGLKDEKHERVGGGYYSDAEVLSLPDDDTYIPLCIATQATPNAHE